jgi:hypothetical protein
VRSFKAFFWRVAHSRYNGQNPSKFWERSWYCYAGMFAFTWSFALVTNWDANRDKLLNATVIVGVPLSIGLAMRRIRQERAKGSDALYRKRISYNG